MLFLQGAIFLFILIFLAWTLNGRPVPKIKIEVNAVPTIFFTTAIAIAIFVAGLVAFLVAK